MEKKLEELVFLSGEQARDLAARFGTPLYVYDHKLLETKAREALAFPNAYGLTVRYAMKASPNGTILKIFDRMGLHMDASSGYEAERAMIHGIDPKKILLTAQQMPDNLPELIELGIMFNACSLHQLETYGQLFPNRDVSVRINPENGSGSSIWTNVSGIESSFGIWHEYADKIRQLAERYGLRVRRIHTHIGSGADPEIWKHVAILSMRYVDLFKDAKILNLGGGYKVRRMPDEKGTDFQEIGMPIRQAFIDFYKKTGRQVSLEIEPGTYLVANAGCVLCTVMDVVDTGPNGHSFIKVDSGMTEVTRPLLYGSKHPMVIIAKDDSPRARKEQALSGHCCETGDTWTPGDGRIHAISPRNLPEARRGDLLVLEGAGAYCSGMSTKNYNSFPEAAEVLVGKDNVPYLIRRRQTVGQQCQNEVMPGFLS